MDRNRRRRFRTVQDITVLLLMFGAMGWLVAGWWTFSSDSFKRASILLPYMWLCGACIGLASNVVADWHDFSSRLSRGVITAYFASLVGLVTVSIAALARANDILGLAGSILLLVHIGVWWAMALQRRRPITH